MTYTFSTLFSGGELAGIGMLAAGWRHLWGVEQDQAIANVAHMNGFEGVLVADVRCVDFSKLARPDHLHASPPCTRASVANSDATESKLDIELAEAVCRALRALRPDTFTLENVYGYRKFVSYQTILRTVCEIGYEMEQHHVNAALYGVPQTRMRLILRASKVGRLKPLQPTHCARTQAHGMFAEYAPLPSWIGWYVSIEDLIPTLPESRFADWQIMRLPSELTGDFLHMTSNTQKANPTGTGENARPAPANTVTSGDGARPRAFLTDSCINTCREATCLDGKSRAFTVKAEAFLRPITEPKAFLLDCQHTSERTTPAGERSLTVRLPEEPAVTMLSSRTEMSQKAFIVDGKPASYDGALSVTEWASPTPTLTASQEKHPFRAFITRPTKYGPEERGKGYYTDMEPTPTVLSSNMMQRAWLDQGRVVSMTPRALARFQSVPDTYILPANKKLACVVIGNGVACLMMQRIAESLR